MLDYENFTSEVFRLFDDNINSEERINNGEKQYELDEFTLEIFNSDNFKNYLKSSDYVKILSLKIINDDYILDFF